MTLEKLSRLLLLATCGFYFLVPTLVQASELSTSTQTRTVEEPSSSTETTETTVTVEEPQQSTSSETTSETSTSEGAVEVPETTPSIQQGILEAIIGKDDQYRVTTTTADPYRKVVHLELYFAGKRYLGSGTMISPDTVLTAAHNVYDRPTKKWADEVIVFPAKNGEENPYGSYVAKDFYAMRGYIVAQDKEERRASDMALIKLSEPVDAHIGALPVSKSILPNSRIQVVGYPAATESKKNYMYTMFGGVVELTENHIEYTIDTEGGQSGGPVLNEQNEIVGVHIISRSENGTYYQNAARRVKDDTYRMIDMATNGLPTTPEIASNTEHLTGTIYRLYNKEKDRYFYTRSLDEARVLELRGWTFEGKGFQAATTGQIVYRLYNVKRNAYLYTTSTIERDSIIQKGWRNEGFAWYASGNRKVFRLFNSKTKLHMYTDKEDEIAILKTRGWKYEGVAFYTN